MRNNHGSILVVTLGFILVFTLLGVASIHLGSIQVELAEKSRASEEAFWLADGALQQILTKTSTQFDNNYQFSPNPFILSQNGVGNDRSYAVNPPPANPPGVTIAFWTDANGAPHPFSHRWTVKTTGTVNNQSRTIQADISNYDISNAITSTGDVGNGSDCKPDGNATVNGVCEQNATFTFESVFNGFSLTDICLAAQNNGTLTLYPNSLNCTKVDPPPSNPANSNGYGGIPNAGVTIVQFGKNDASVNLNPGSGIVIVDSRTSTKSSPKVNIGYNSAEQFNGIIWVIGDAKVTAAPGTIHGTLFVNGSLTPFGGASITVYDPTAIDAALGQLGNGFTTQAPYVVSWKEI